MGELSSCDGDCMSYTLENIYYLALHRKSLPTPELHHLNKTFQKITWHFQAEHRLAYISIVVPPGPDIMCLWVPSPDELNAPQGQELYLIYLFVSRAYQENWFIKGGQQMHAELNWAI